MFEVAIEPKKQQVEAETKKPNQKIVSSEQKKPKFCMQIDQLPHVLIKEYKSLDSSV